MKHLSIICLILLLLVGVTEYSVAQTSAPPTSSWAVTPNPGEYGTILFKPVQYGGVFMINGRPMAAGDAIGVFFYDGTVRKCGGYIVWQGTTNDMNYALNVWENDTLTPGVKEGFYPGETLNFMMWDAQLQMEVPVVNLVCNTNGIPAVNYPYLGPCQTTYSGNMLFMYDAIYGDVLVAPSLVSPENLSTNIALNPTLSWQAVPTATGYFVEVSTSNTFSTTVYSGTVTNNSFQLIGLMNNTTYYWRVKALRGTTETEWSSVWSFTTIQQPLTAVVLTAPADGATNVSLTPTLEWQSVATATGYEVQVSTSNTFTTTVYSGTTTNLTQSLSGLSNNTTYYWRVRALRGTEQGPWSSVWSFTTLPGVTGYTVSGYVKYKNTAQTAMNNCTVVLKDAQGQTIGTTVTNTQGYYEFTNVANGNYNIEISTSKAHGGLTNVDILRIRQHLQNIASTITPFTGVRLLAADVYALGTLNSLDILQIRRRIQNLSYSWSASNYVFYPTSISINNSNLNHNIESLCSGDVDGSFTPPSN